MTWSCSIFSNSLVHLYTLVCSIFTVLSRFLQGETYGGRLTCFGLMFEKKTFGNFSLK